MGWKDTTKRRYFWMSVEEDVDNILLFLETLETEEETDLYRLEMHLANADELAFFAQGRRREIRTLLAELIRDTRRHSRTLMRIRRLLARFKKRNTSKD